MLAIANKKVIVENRGHIIKVSAADLLTKQQGKELEVRLTVEKNKLEEDFDAMSDKILLNVRQATCLLKEANRLIAKNGINEKINTSIDLLGGVFYDVDGWRSSDINC